MSSLTRVQCGWGGKGGRDSPLLLYLLHFGHMTCTTYVPHVAFGEILASDDLMAEKGIPRSIEEGR